MKRKKYNNVVANNDAKTASELISAKHVTNEELAKAISEGADVIMKSADGKHVRIQGIKPVKGFEDFIAKLSGKDADDTKKEAIRNMTEVWSPETANVEETEIIFIADKSLKDINILFNPKF